MTTPASRPAQGQIVQTVALTKRFGSFAAVDGLDLTVAPGRITGFLGPNGAGKTTTLRMILGLVAPTSGSATIGGRRYADLPHPAQTVGAALEATNFHPGRSGRDHLRVLAAASQVPTSRVDEMLDLVGIPAAARKRAGQYSMGMRQRLGLAAALLGNPSVLILDEPSNGLDPEGIRWLRELLRYLASQGMTVLVSSHLLAEVDQMVDDVAIIANGRLVTSGPIETLRGVRSSRVRTSDPTRLAEALRAAGIAVELGDDGMLAAQTDDLVRVGDLALAAGLPIHELSVHRAALEDLYFSLTSTPESADRNRVTANPKEARRARTRAR
ncbi:MAG: ABC transporter ATP-binding protein [Dermatophilaceae bacterium]|jgi:ABC-2 type transport system ATP-binding protein|nr:ABC transporter ATP-binding protein [Dermatophilaceae bacterium]